MRLGEPGQRQPEAPGSLFQKMRGQQRDVLLALAQGRHLDGEDVEPVIEVLPEAALLRVLLQVAVGGGDDADIDGARLLLADALILLLLQDAQELALEREGDLADLIEEERAAVGGFEAAGAVFDRAGEGAFDVAEELALVKLAGDGGAVDADERALGAAAETVDFAGDEFLAGAGFAEDEHGGVGGRDQLDLAEQLLDGRAVWPMMSPKALASRTSSCR